jgi:hypothetical protein
VGVEVFAQQCGEERREVDAAGGGGGFGWSDPALPVGFVQRPFPGVDGDDAPVQVDVVAVESGEFAPAAPGQPAVMINSRAMGPPSKPA